MYSEQVLNEFYNPQNVGVIKGASGVGKVGNPACGDIMKVYIMVENGKIVDAKFQTFGCAAAIASSSVATRMIIGKTIEEALKITNQDVIKELGGEMPSSKIHCSILAEEAIRAAVDNYYKKKDRKSDDADDEDEE